MLLALECTTCDETQAFTNADVIYEPARQDRRARPRGRLAVDSDAGLHHEVLDLAGIAASTRLVIRKAFL
eukprot:4402481-Pyramimonas_sp.AAC.1